MDKLYEEIIENQIIEHNRMLNSSLNILFLDVDGVLNTNTTKERSPQGYVGVTQNRIKLVKEILDFNNAVLVFTTSWKKLWSFNEISDMDSDVLYLISNLAEDGVFACDKTEDESQFLLNRG